MMVTKVKRNKAKRNSLITIVALGSILASCSNIKVRTPSSRFISPEAQGKFFSANTQIEVQNTTEAEFDFENNDVESLSLAGNRVQTALALDLGLHEKVDLVIKSNGDAPTVTSMKFQLYGKPRLKAKKGDQSIAVTFGAGKESDTDLKDSIFNVSGSTKADVEQSLIDFSVILGHRMNDDSLAYLSLSATKHNAKGSFSSSNAQIDGKDFDIQTWSYVTALGAIRYYKNLVLNVEANLQKTHWTGNQANTYGNISAAIGLKFD